MHNTASRVGRRAVLLFAAALIATVCSASLAASASAEYRTEFELVNNSPYTLKLDTRDANTFTTGYWHVFHRPPTTIRPFEKRLVIACNDENPGSEPGIDSQLGYYAVDQFSIPSVKTGFTVRAGFRLFMGSAHPLFELNDLRSTLAVRLVRKDTAETQGVTTTYTEVEVNSLAPND